MGPSFRAHDASKLFSGRTNYIRSQMETAPHDGSHGAVLLTFDQSARLLLLRLLERQNRFTGRKLRRRDDVLHVHAAELFEVVALDALVLDLHHA